MTDTTQGAEGLEPLTMQDVRLHMGEGPLTPSAVLVGCNMAIASRSRRTPSPPGGATKEEIAQLIAPNARDWSATRRDALDKADAILTRLQSAREGEKVEIPTFAMSLETQGAERDAERALMVERLNATSSPRSGEEHANLIGARIAASDGPLIDCPVCGAVDSFRRANPAVIHPAARSGEEERLRLLDEAYQVISLTCGPEQNGLKRRLLAALRPATQAEGGETEAK